MATETPNTPQELLNLNQKEEVTPEALLEAFLELSYEDQDNFIYKLLKGQLKFHEFLLGKSREGDKSLPDTERLIVDCVKLAQCVELYGQVQ